MFSVDELLDFLIEKKYIEEKPTEVNGNVIIERFSSLANPTESSLCWAKKLLNVNDIPDCAVLICLPEQEHDPDLETLMIHVAEPRRVFGDVVEKFCPEKELTGISPSAEIHPSVKLGKDVFIGPKCVIAEGCEIGDKTRIDANVTIYDHVKIGKRCHISSGAVIGADGHGYYLDENKRYKKIRHMGGVSIGDDVDIGANSCVDRGVLDDTQIGDNTKIDNLVQVAHNVVIGENCIITGGCQIGGSAKIGNNCWLSLASVIKNGISLFSETRVDMNSSVFNSNKVSNETLFGTPAKKTIPYYLGTQFSSDSQLLQKSGLSQIKIPENINNYVKKILCDIIEHEVVFTKDNNYMLKSLDVLRIIMEFEENKISISFDDVTKIKTIGDLYDIIANLYKKGDFAVVNNSF